MKETSGGNDPGVLRFDFPGGAGGDELQRLDWDERFGKFESSGLALLHQKQKADGSPSTFFKLVNR